MLAAGIVTAAALAVVGQFALPLPDGVAPLLFHLGVSRSFARTLLDVRSLAALTVAVVAGAALTVETIRRPTRRVKVLAAGGLVVAGAVASVAVAWLTHPRAVHVTMSAWLDAALAVLAVAGAVSLFVEGLELGGVARLVTDLGDVDAPMALQHSIGRALDDPSVELWFWSAGLGAYVTLDGSRGDPERTRPGRVLTRLSARDEPLAVVVHDAARDIPDHRVAAVCAAARMALDNERLHAQVRAQLADATASRARIVVAGDQARREIERNLHDGTQQRLLAVLLRLREAEERHRRAGERAGSAALADEVGLAADELAVALEELRAIARGLHPPALDHGLAAALDALAETAPLPVELHTPADLPAAGPEIEAAVYFFVAEALTNTVRHAGATHLAVTVERTASGLRATAADDGCGGAACRGGTGLARLGDRAAALGGQLRVDSRAEAGTTLVLELPTAPPGEATADVVP